MQKRALLSLVILPFIVALAPADPPPPVPAACQALSSTVERIAGLQTGQAVDDQGTTTLRFSSDVRACGEWSNEVRGSDCLDRWSFHIDLPKEALVPGEHQLSELGASFGDLIVTTSPETGCGHECRTGVKGTGSVPLTSSEATIVIDSIDDACITGTIRGLSDPSFKDAPNFNGAFFALRCDR
jgi:hypothetical protein